jgi:hypothetical protein
VMQGAASAADRISKIIERFLIHTNNFDFFLIVSC